MNIKQARICANLIVFSYHDQTDQTLDQIKEYGFQEVRFYNKNGAQAFVAHNDKEIYIIFRGTEFTKKNDVFRNLSLWPRRAEKIGKVHTGYADATDQIWKEISYHLDAVVLTHPNMDRNVYFAGHSQGGAMAIISAARSKYNSSVFTFGTPRMSNRKFLRNIKSTIIRFTNGNDIVPALIPAGFYRHSKPEYKLIDDKVYLIHHKYQSAKLWVKLAAKRLIRFSLISSIISDHQILSYAFGIRFMVVIQKGH